MTELSAGAIAWVEKRGISAEVAVAHGIYSDKHEAIGNCIVFPVIEHGKIVNRKWRNQEKDFRQDYDGTKTFTNADIMEDPAVLDGAPLVITEGEMDMLSAVEAGYPFVMSVPDGAPAHRTAAGDVVPEESGDIEDIEDDRKFSYIWHCKDRLFKVPVIVIATDGDEPGQRLQRELVRRLGPVRCRFVTYPADCKDLNDVLLKHGGTEVNRVISEAKPFPVKGLYRLSDYPDKPNPKTYPLGIPGVDDAFKPFRGSFTVVTGVPGHGKSTVINSAAARLVREHGLKVAIGSFESAPVPFLRDHLRTFHIKRPHEVSTRLEIIEADRWIERNFVFIDQDPVDDEDEIDLHWIIEKAEESVIRDGIDLLVIDPWNEIEHKKMKGESETEYTSRAIRLLKRLARRRDIMVWMVAHPVKMGGGYQGITKPNLYDISGSANWYNKCDFGIVIWRDNMGSSIIEWDQKKSKHHHFSGKPGIVPLMYNTYTADFEYAETADEGV